MSPIETLTFAELLDELAAKTPAPGGGAVAAAVGALAGALGGMVISYSVGKKSLAEHKPELELAANRLLAARGLLLALAKEDSEAFGLLSELRRLPEGDPRRIREEPAAKVTVLGAPRATMAAALDLLRLFESLAPITNKYLHSDLAVAAVLGEATARSAWWNVHVNLSMASDTDRPRIIREGLASLEDARTRRERIERACTDGATA